jgi:gliding motility-associated-like protein
MKKKFIPAMLLASFALGKGLPAQAQITACGDAFVKGNFVEVGVHPNGGFGSSCAAPAGYHPNVAGTGDALGFVSDPEKDGWLVSVPPSPRYMGDYFVPGSPYEGWAIQANSGTIGFGRGRTGSTGITGSNVSYTATATQEVTVWQGTYGNLAITQTTTLKKDKLYFVMNVEIVNTGTMDLPGVYYFRGVDPDNEVPWGGTYSGYSTVNEIVFQPNATSKNCLVTGTGHDWPYMSYLGLGTKDCRARCMNLPGWYPANLAEAFTGLGSGAGYQRTVGWKTAPLPSQFDEAIGVVWNLGTLAAGQRTTLAYTYILKKDDLDSALQETAPKFVSDGIPFAAYSTFRVCPGKSISLKIINGGQYKWIWTPSTDMNPVAGTTIVGPGGTLPTVTGGATYADGAALGDSVSVNVFGPKEYRATGISNCDTQVLIFYVDIIKFDVPPSVTTPVRYCEDDVAAALTAGTATGATLRWYTAATGGIFSTTAPTPSTAFPAGSTADYDTSYYYVSQVNPAGCETPRAKIQVIITRKPVPPSVTSLVYCKGVAADPLTATGDALKWYDAATAGTRYITTPVPATTTAGLVSYYVSQTANGCESDRAQLDVETSEIVAAFEMLKDSLCGADFNMFYNHSKSTALLDTNYRSHWTYGDGATDTTKDANHSYADGMATYTVKLKVTNIYGCMDSVTHTLWTFPQPSMGLTASDTLICQGNAIDFTGTATPGYNGITWDFGDSDPAYDDLNVRHAFSTAGKFNVKIIGNYPACPDINASVPVTIIAIPVVNLGPDTSLCTGSTAIILSNKSGIASEHYQWSTGDTTATISVNHDGAYWLRASNGDCSATDSITVTKSCYLDIPNAFTPDGGSDAQGYFLPRQLLSKSVVTFDMKIFDRWGQMLFESDKTDGRGWDGNFKGKAMPLGVYVYLIKVSYTNGITESYQGNITLIR